MAIRKLAEFKAAFEGLKATLPPAPLEAVRHIAAPDLAFLYAQEPELMLNLVLRITADAIVACRKLPGSEAAAYLSALRMILNKLNSLPSAQVADTELATYLRKLDHVLAEFP